MIRFFVLICVFIPTILTCQIGNIRGQVTDAKSGDPLVGANVVVVGSKPGHGAASDMNGMFLMNKIPSGEYVVRASYIDYQTVTMQNVKVNAGQTTVITFAMRKEGDPDSLAAKVLDTLVVQKDTLMQPPPEAVTK